MAEDGELRLDLRVDGEVLVVERSGFSSEELPLLTATGAIRIVIDADLVEVFGPASYGAYRIRPAVSDRQRLTVDGQARVDTLVR
jgi:hypothetical protein